MSSPEEFNEAAGWADVTGEDMTPEQEAQALQDAPQPQLWRILIRPKSPRQVSRGGIVIASQAKDAESHLQYIGRVVAVGPLVGKSERYLDPETKASAYYIQVGDWVAYGRYAGQRLVHRGLRLLVINDDEVLCLVENPDALKVYV